MIFLKFQIISAGRRIPLTDSAAREHLKLILIHLKVYLLLHYIVSEELVLHGVSLQDLMRHGNWQTGAVLRYIPQIVQTPLQCHQPPGTTYLHSFTFSLVFRANFPPSLTFQIKIFPWLHQCFFTKYFFHVIYIGVLIGLRYFHCCYLLLGAVSPGHSLVLKILVDYTICATGNRGVTSF